MDDVIATAHWLISKKYTSPAHLGAIATNAKKADADEETFLLWQSGDREFQFRRARHTMRATAKGFD